MLEDRCLRFRQKGKRIGADLDLDRVAEMTNGFSGADITSIVNTAVSLVLQEYLAAYQAVNHQTKYCLLHGGLTVPLLQERAAAEQLIIR